MLGLIEEAFLLKISKAINESLFDAIEAKQSYKQKLANLNNKIVKIILKSSIANALCQSELLPIFNAIKPEYYLCFENNQIKILRHLDSEKSPDLSIVMSVNGLFKAKIMGINDALRNNEIELHGNLNVAMDLQALLNSANSDISIKDLLQEKLARYTSDAFSWYFIKLLNDILSHIQVKNLELSEQIVDYLQLETQFLVSQCEIDIFCNAVDKLQDDIARLTARVARCL